MPGSRKFPSDSPAVSRSQSQCGTAFIDCRVSAIDEGNDCSWGGRSTRRLLSYRLGPPPKMRTGKRGHCTFSGACPSFFASQSRIATVLIGAQARPPPGPHGRLNSQFNRRRSLPLCLAKRRSSINALSECLQFPFGFSAFHYAGPLRWFRNRPIRQQSHWATSLRRLEARPLPILAPLHELRSQRIAFDVPQGCQKVVIILNGKGFEPPLPDMPTSLVVPMVPTNMGCHQPLHPPTEVTITLRPKHQMKMVGHEAIADQPHRDSFMGLTHQTDKRREILVLVKNIPPTIPAIQDMVDIAPSRRSSCSCHSFSLRTTPRPVK